MEAVSANNVLQDNSFRLIHESRKSKLINKPDDPSVQIARDAYSRTLSERVYSNYDTICALHSSSQYSHSFNLDDVSILDELSLLCRLAPHRIISILKGLPASDFYDRSANIRIPVGLLSPPEVDTLRFHYGRITPDSPEQATSVGKTFTAPDLVYMPNTSLAAVLGPSNSLPKSFRFDGPMTKSQVRQFCNHGLQVMVRTFSNQLRFGTHLLEITSMLFTRQAITHSDTPTTPPSSDTVHKRGCDLVGMQAIRKLLAPYPILPFRLWKDGSISHVPEAGECSTMLPLLIISLLQTSFNELSCALTSSEALSAVNYQLKCAETSLQGEVMKNKGRIDKFEVLAYNRLGRVSIVERSKDGRITGARVDEDHQDVDQGITLKDLDRAIVTETPEITSILKDFRNNLKLMASATPEGKLDIVRYAINQLRMSRSSYLYHHTSLRLGYQGSNRPVSTEPTGSAPPRDTFTFGNHRVPITLDYLSDSGSDYRPIHKALDKVIGPVIAEGMKTFDANKVFFDSLTNNSEGKKPYDPDLTPVENKFTNNRKFAAAYPKNQQALMSFSGFMEMLASPLSSGYRAAPDRQIRFIVMVTNAWQASVLPLYYALELSKPKLPSIKVGKQTGDARSAQSQLYATGKANILTESADISQADASTKPSTSRFMLYWANGYVKENTTEKFFFCQTKDGVSALCQFTSLAYAAQVEQIITMNDPCFTADGGDFVKAATFQSGQLSTTAQHTLFFIGVIQAALDKYDEVNPGVLAYLIVLYEVMGDDIYITVENPSGDPALVPRQEEVLTYITSAFRRYNYNIKRSTSKIFSVLLQQGALAGTHVPFGWRITVFSNERPELLNKPKIARFKVMIDYISEASQRYPCPVNSMCLIPSIWTAMRCSTVGTVTGLITEPPFITENSGTTMTLAPWLAQHVNPFYAPMPPYSYKGNAITGSSPAGPRSDIVWLLLYPLISTPGACGPTIRPTSRIDWKKVKDLGLHLVDLFNHIDYLSTLSEMRAKDTVRIKYWLETNGERNQDQRRRERSINAMHKIRDLGLDVPFDLTYWGRPSADADQTILSKVETSEETDAIYKMLHSRFTVKRPVGLPKVAMALIDRCCIMLIPGKPISPHQDYNNLHGVHVIPSYHRLSPFGSAFCKFGSSFSKQNRSDRGYTDTLRRLGVDNLVKPTIRVFNGLVKSGVNAEESKRIIVDMFGINGNQASALFGVLDKGLRAVIQGYTTYYNYPAVFDINVGYTDFDKLLEPSGHKVADTMAFDTHIGTFIRMFRSQVADLLHSNTDVYTTTYCLSSSIVVDPYSLLLAKRAASSGLGAKFYDVVTV